MSLTPTYKPIDGEEGREIIKRTFNEKIDKIPMMKRGHAYHKFEVEATVVIKAYPKDVPVPEVEFKKLVKVADNPKESFAEVEKQVEALEKHREDLLKKVKEIDTTLNILRPQEIININEKAGDTPDELRIAKGMPIPMIERTGAGIREVRVDASKLQVQK